MTNEEIENIRKEIQKTGASLEVEIASLLEADQWLTLHDVPYVDTETHTLRTIDLVALKNTWDTFTILVLDCHRRVGQSPWVFYVKESSVDVLESSLLGLLPIRRVLLEKHGRVALAFRTLGPGKEEVAEAMACVSKALSAIVETSEDLPLSALTEVKLLKDIVCLPLVIYDGHLYQFSSYDGGDVHLVECVTYCHLSKDAPLITILHKDQFREWLTTVQTKRLDP